MKRRSMRALCVAVVIAFASMALLYACSNGSSSAQRQAAETGLDTLRSMAGSSEFLFFGYESASDVGKEELGEPIEIKTIDVDALLKSEVPNDLMIVDGNEYLFPVMVRAKPIGSIQIMIDDNTWEYVAIRSKAEVEKALEIISANSLAIDNIYLLDLEEIEMAFVGYVSNGRNILIPIFSGTSTPFVPGTKYEFTEIAAIIKDAIISAQESYNNMVPPNLGDRNESQVQTTKELLSNRSSFSRARKDGGKTNNLLNINLFPQEEDQWCWAATARMTMLFAGGDPNTITQCAQANDAFTQDSCCKYGDTKQCNKPYYPLYENWGFTAKNIYKPEGAALSWTALKGLIDSGNPVAFLWRWKSGGGHYMVAVGYYEDQTTNPVTQMVHINDPWPPSVGEKHSVTYKKWIGGPQYNNLQTCYYYDIVKK